MITDFWLTLDNLYKYWDQFLRGSFFEIWISTVQNVVPLEVEANLQPKVSRSVCLGVRHPPGTRDQFLFLFEISFRQLPVCYFVAPCLTRGRSVI
jgi:hypothetical protein